MGRCRNAGGSFVPHRRFGDVLDLEETARRPCGFAMQAHAHRAQGLVRKAITDASDWLGPSFQPCADAAMVASKFAISRRREVQRSWRVHGAVLPAVPGMTKDPPQRMAHLSTRSPASANVAPACTDTTCRLKEHCERA